MTQQKKAFIQYEADSWFERNLSYIRSYDVNDDKTVANLDHYKLNPEALLEIGCSGGYRLNGIKNKFKNCVVHGIEPSKKAIAYGKQTFPRVLLNEGTADDLSIYSDQSMDVVIVGFIFYVIDRQILLKVISEVDRVLKNGGVLIIVDFFSPTPIKTHYQHIKDFNAFSFKQNYYEIFESSKLYHLLDKFTLNHNSKEPDASDDYSNKYGMTLLRKDLLASYK